MDSGHIKNAVVGFLLLVVTWGLPSMVGSQEPRPGTITSVTVYPGIANVERTVALPEGEPGQRLLQLGPLPSSLRESTIRVTAEGEVQVLSVKVRRSSGDPVEPQSLKDLRGQIAEAKKSLLALQRQDETLAAHQARYEGLVPEKPGSSVNSPLSKEAWQGLAELILSGMKNATDQRILLAPKILVAKTTLEKLEQELATYEVKSGRNKAVIEIESLDLSGTGGVFRVEYQVTGAIWKPIYQVHVQEETDQIQLKSYAEVYQWTGEDWPAVPMFFSTSLPESGAEPGSLSALKIERPRFFQPEPVMSRKSKPLANNGVDYKESPRRRTEQLQRGRIPEQPPVLGGLSFDRGKVFFYEGEDKAGAVDGLDDRGFLTVFEAIHAEQVKSTGSPHRRLYSIDTLPFKAVHRCIPELETAVFRRLLLSLNGEEPLLAGEVSVFAGRDYLGMTRIENTVAPGEEWALDLGTMDQIVVSRNTVESEETRGLLSRLTEYRTETRLKLENYSDSAETIEILERIPVSDEESVSIEIDKSKTEPAPENQKPVDGILRWSVTVEPGKSRELRLIWTMQIPKDKILLRRQAPERLGGE